MNTTMDLVYRYDASYAPTRNLPSLSRVKSALNWIHQVIVGRRGLKPGEPLDVGEMWRRNVRWEDEFLKFRR